jgi:selenocysteine-specific elongation factor
MKSVIVGTAGHIDHGKSALVEALTGTHPDRLEEEKRRGITLDLGFAFLEADGLSLGFVDVPGHERFVRNMLAGAGGFDLVLLVIAADESIKPQTREHFDICRLLGIPRGVIALTKCDLAGADAVHLVRLEVEEFVRGSFLEDAPIIPVSAKSGQGMAELREALAGAAQTARPKDSSRYFRLPIDRAFAMKGFGTVVTGTLISGDVQAGDEVELFPSRRRARIRGVQSAGKPLAQATAGQRTALNLAGIDLADVNRGMVLAAAGRFQPTSLLDVRVTLLASAERLKQRARVRLHHGTAETIAVVDLLDAREVAPGGSALAQLRLAEPLLALPSDRFILRQLTPAVTIGGGAILDALAARHSRHDARATAMLGAIERTAAAADGQGLHNVLAEFVAVAPGGTSLASLVARTGWLEAEIREAAESLAAAGRVVIASRQPFLVAAAGEAAACAARICSEVERFHRDHPLTEGISKEELRVRTAAVMRPELFRAVLGDLASAGRLEVAGDVVKQAGRTIEMRPEEVRASQQIEAEFAAAGLAAPAVEAVLARLPVEGPRASKLLQLLLREGTLVRVSDQLILHRAAMDRLRERLAEYKKTRGERLSVAAFKDMAGVSRRYAIPLLEYLDQKHVTRRLNDERVIL